MSAANEEKAMTDANIVRNLETLLDGGVLYGVFLMVVMGVNLLVKQQQQEREILKQKMKYAKLNAKYGARR